MLLILCSCDVLSAMMYIRPVNVFVNHFGVIGGSKLGFWMKEGLRNRRFWSVQMMLRLSEATRRLSELPFSCPELEFDRSLKRKPSEQ